MSLRLHAQVVEVHGMLVTVRIDALADHEGAGGGVVGRRLRARPPRDRTTPVIGDICEVEVEVAGEAALRELLEAGAARRAEARLTRLVPRARVYERLGLPRQVLASNVDRLVIVSSVDPGPRPGLIDRMWVALADPAVEVVLVLNKADLPGCEEASHQLADHVRAGATLTRTSTMTGEGVDALRALLGTGLSVMVGHSGVGKSSLVNALRPEAGLAVGAVNATTRKGRHTTTVATCHELAGPDGGVALLVDTPGVRAFALDALAEEEAASRFPGLGPLAKRCHFAGCLHEAEPGCAVLEARDGGDTAVAAHHGRWLALLASMREERLAPGVRAENPRKARRGAPRR